MHPHSANWVVIKRAVVYYPRDAYTFSAGIKCRHCIFILESHNTGKSHSEILLALLRFAGSITAEVTICKLCCVTSSLVLRLC